MFLLSLLFGVLLVAILVIVVVLVILLVTVLVIVVVLVILVILVVFFPTHAVPPTYDNLGPLAVNTQEGVKDFKIDLPLSARPLPVFEWTLNNNVIQETANRMLTASSLRLATVDRADRGKYVVSANNSAGSDTVTIILNITCELERETKYMYMIHIALHTPAFTLFISDPPRFNAENTTVAFRPREDATLDCSVDSNPTADISISTPSGSTASRTPDGMITISNIMMSDAGVYTCRASNSIGTEVILTYTVEVRGN